MTLARLILGWQDVRNMNASKNQFSLTRATPSTSWRAKNPIPISISCLVSLLVCVYWAQAQNSNSLPPTQWAITIGGSASGNAYRRGLTTDAAGNVYMAGPFQGTNVFGGTTLVSRGGDDIFLAK